MKKWKTVCSASTKEELQKMINSYYFSTAYVIGDSEDGKHFPVIDTTNFRVVRHVARYNRKRWQYGSYDT